LVTDIEELLLRIDTNENKNFRKWLIHPSNFFSVFGFYFAKLKFRIKKKFFKNQFYSKEIRSFSKNKVNLVLPKEGFLHAEKVEKENIVSFGSFIEKKISNEKINFFESFEDSECSEALHRLSFLSIESNDPQWGFEQINHWLDTFKNDQQSDHLEYLPRWQPYTVSERLLNISKFIKKHDVGLNKDRESFFKFHVSFLIQNLEIQDPYTGNHIINNARALLVVGENFSCQNCTKLSIVLLNHYLKKVTSPDGLLNEGSTHYSFLFFSWIDEIHLLLIKSSLAPKELVEFFKNLREKSLQNLSHLNHGGQYALVGDISPDVSPAELSEKLKLNTAEVATDEEGSDLSFKKFHHFNLWFRKSKSDSTSHVGHFHQDLLHYSLSYMSHEILVDSGRQNYLNSYPSKAQIRSVGHNSVIVDSTEILPFPFLKYPQSYAPGSFSVETFNFGIKFKTNLFNRNKKNGREFNRKLSFTESKMSCEDSVSGSAQELLSFYHFAPGFKVKAESSHSLVLESNSMELEIEAKCDRMKLSSFPISKSYGHAVESLFLILETKNTSGQLFSLENTFSIRLLHVRN
jgi:hypothetical protein